MPLRCGLGRPESPYWCEIGLGGDVRLSYDHRGAGRVTQLGGREGRSLPIVQVLTV